MTKHFANLLRKKLDKKSIGKILLNKTYILYSDIIELPHNIIIKELSYMPIGKPFYWYSEKLRQVRDDYIKKNSKYLYEKLLSPQLKGIMGKIGRDIK